MAATPDGQGYWLVASDGGVFTFGDAKFYGSEGGKPLNKPIVGIAATPTATATGWSPATAASSPSATPPSTAPRAASPSTSRSSASPPRPTGNGYWLVASDGGVFTFGDATFYGSAGRQATEQADRRDRHHARRRRLLVGGLRRRYLQLRRRRLLRLQGGNAPERAHRRSSPPRPRRWLLGSGLRRRRVQLRRRRLLRLARAVSRSTRRSSGSPGRRQVWPGGPSSIVEPGADGDRERVAGPDGACSVGPEARRRASRLDAVEVSAWFGDTQVLDDVSLSMPPGIGDRAHRALRAAASRRSSAS